MRPTDPCEHCDERGHCKVDYKAPGCVDEPIAKETAEHTPGPWKWYKRDEGDQAADEWNALDPESEERDYDTILSWSRCGDVVQIECQHANARLIAAAPELFDELARADAIILELWAICQRLSVDDGDMPYLRQDERRAALADAKKGE